MAIKCFEDLEVWNSAKELVLKTYELTASFPRDELFGITAQVKRAALSVPANIAEGFGRYHYLDRAKFYLNARGSLFELKSHMLIAIDLQYVDAAIARLTIQNIDMLGVKINNLISKTRQSLNERKFQ